MRTNPDEIRKQQAELIYQTALLCDADKLKNLLGRLKDEDVYPRNADFRVGIYCILPAVERLIQEGQIKVADFVVFNTPDDYLYSSDSRRQDSYGCIHGIAHHAAKHGYRDFCEKLRIKKKANVTQIAFGAAQFLDRSYVDFLCDHGAEISRAIVGFEIKKDYFNAHALQVKFLMRHSPRFLTRDAVSEYLNRTDQHTLWGGPASINTASQVFQALSLKAKYAGLTDQKVLLLVLQNIAGPLVLLLQLKIFEGLKPKVGASTFCNISFVALLHTFSFIFGAEIDVLHYERGGFGLFLAAKKNEVKKMIAERNNEKRDSLVPQK